MNVEKFINSVYGHKCLWDQSDSMYHSREHQRKAWREISKEFKIPVDELKKKWRGLRDTFGKELKKVDNNQSGEAADTESDSKWRHFNLMSFLQESMSRRDFKGNLSVKSESSDTKDMSNKQMDSAIRGPDHPTSSSSNKIEEQNDEETQKKILKSQAKKKINKTNMSAIEDVQFPITLNDPDAQFLISLLPFLKDVPKKRKLIVRSKLQQVLINEQNATSSETQLDCSKDSTQFGVN